jgi:N-acetylmuramoyl-L-alanine amidase
MLLLLLFAAALSNEQDDSEHPRIATSSQEFVQGTPAALKFLQASSFEQGLETPSLAASSDQDFQKLVDEINAKSPIPGVGIGNAGTTYDVILQPGHYLRTSGRTGTQGKYVSEQALVAYMTSIVATSLRRTGESVLVVSADNYLRPTRSGTDFNGLRSKVFLAIHADGSDRPCTTGPSLGYQRPATALAMNFIGLSLGDALGYDYASFRRNFTANEADYYMFRQVQAGRLTGLLEVGELTCESTERELISSSHAVGANIARGVDFILRSAETALLIRHGTTLRGQRGRTAYQAFIAPHSEPEVPFDAALR